MESKYEHFIWAEDDHGERYVCYFDDNREHNHKYEKLSKEDKSQCRPVEFPWN